jgi:hypothetical protein
MNSPRDIEGTPIEWENYVVVQVIQALLGFVTCRMTSVSVRAERDLVTLFFAFDSHEPADSEDIEDICFELDVLLDGKVRIDSRIHVGADDDAWDGYSFRRVYRAKR